MIDEQVKHYSEQLTKLGIEHTIVEHPELKTSEDVQGFLGLTLKDGLSTMIMKGDDRFIAVIRRDDCHINFSSLKKIFNTKELRMATDKEFIELTGMPVGAARVVNQGIETYLDKRLFEVETLTGGSGSFLCSVRYNSKDLKKIPNSHVVDIALINETQSTEKGKRILSGITPSGDASLHIGNYLGAVKQFKDLAQENDCFLFVADLHALTTVQDKEQLEKNVEALILNELALLGDLNPSTGASTELSRMSSGRITFFRQSDVPEHTELSVILSNYAPLGLIKRAHAYKDKLEKEMKEEDINMGLFCYPILMAADILLYKPDLVPVGKDQKQHVEITRDIAERFNKTYRTNTFKLPDAFIPENVATILGTDGKRKMSKSLGNIISIFEDEEIIKKQVMATYTDPTRIHASDPGHIEGNMVFTYLNFFGDPTSSGEAGLRGASKVEQLKELYRQGKVADVEVKTYLFESLMTYFADARKRYQELKQNPEEVKKILKSGAEKARSVAGQTMEEVRNMVGLVNTYSFTENFIRPPLAETPLRGGKGEALKTEAITIDDFAKVELRVGYVEQAEYVEKSEKLIRLHVEFGSTFVPQSGTTAGEAGLRTIFTGVRGFGYTPDDFRGKQFFFVTNLKSKKMLGEESQGMIMAVDGAGGKPLFVSAEGLPIGAVIR